MFINYSSIAGEVPYAVVATTPHVLRRPRAAAMQWFCPRPTHTVIAQPRIPGGPREQAYISFWFLVGLVSVSAVRRHLSVTVQWRRSFAPEIVNSR